MASRESVPLSSTHPPPRPPAEPSQRPDSPSAAREADRTQSHPDALISHLFHLCDPSVQQAFEPSHLTREWLDSLPIPPGCTRRPEPSSNAQWALVEQWRIAAGTIRYYAQFATDSWYQHQYWQQHQAAANSLHNPPWGSAFENDVRAEQYRLFGSAPLTERVAAAAAADAAFLGAFSSHPNGQQQQHEWLSSTGHGREVLNHDDQEEEEEGNEIEDDDDDEDYEDEEEDDEDDDGREFSFPIDLAALAKSAGMPFPASGSGSGSGQPKGGASTYEDIVNRLAQAQQQVQQSGGDRGFTPAQLLQLQSAGAMIEPDEGAGGGGELAGPVANGILSDSTDPLSLGPASLPSLMAAISELEQCVARLSLEASEARSLQRRMRDELGAPPAITAAGAGGDTAYGGEGGGAGGEERLRAAMEKKKMRNKKKKDKKKAKAAAAAAAEEEEAALSQQQQQQVAATETGDDGAEPASTEESGNATAAAAANGVGHMDHSLSASHGQTPTAATGEQASQHKKEDGELIKALQSVSMLDRRADEYRERLRVLKEQIHHHAALADALAASSSSPASSSAIPAHAAQSHSGYHPHQHHQNGTGTSSGPTLGSLNAAAVASATVPLYYDGAQGQEGQIGEFGDDDEEEDEGDLYEEEEEEEEEEEVMEGSHSAS
ncbi:hypothetical protein RHOSPDRAFT_27725 [Rhodotorula sp. JG-1b]|nr:hypothetical protein RHOSPDRAFT_27725 [Rhodotorula sp. JG-1b]